jgi:hypothetical protein
MRPRPTSDGTRVNERQKALARLVLLAVVGLFCPPLAAARSGGVWVLYLVLVLLYSLWAVALTRRFSKDRRVGYLLCVTDGAALAPLLVWSPGVAMRIVLVVLWAAGLATTFVADGLVKRLGYAGALGRKTAASPWDSVARAGPWGPAGAAPLERALRVRLRVLDSTGTRFGLVLLRMIGHEEISAYYGEGAIARLQEIVGRKGLNLLGADAQVFALPGARTAFVFATEAPGGVGSPLLPGAMGRVDPYDVESVAMALAEKACEQTVDSHPLECVVGWASAPADGRNPDDLMYAAESGALSTAAFRRVSGSGVPLPESEKKRAVAG